MERQRLINCDFLNFGGFLDNISNKAKLVYFMFIVNADDKGFVGNGNILANTLDQCEEKFDNVLFNYKYIDSIQELVDKGFVYEFQDKHGNKTFLIRHWFRHNKPRNGLTTLFISYLAQVELIDGEYHWKNNKEKNLKGKEIKIKEIKVNESKINNEEINNKESDGEMSWDEIMQELNSDNKTKEPKPFQELDDLPEDFDVTDPFDFSK